LQRNPGRYSAALPWAIATGSPCTPDITLGAVAEKPRVVDRKMENREYLSTDERLSLTALQVIAQNGRQMGSQNSA